MRSNKTQVKTLEKYIKDFNKNSRISFYMGGVSGYDTNDADYSDISFVSLIPKNDISPMIRRIDWIKNQIYVPYNSLGNSENDLYYAYNKINGIVYLCLSNNSKNRVDLTKTSVSRIAPNHLVGIQTYEDGYRWAAIYKIDLSLQKFVTANQLPVPNVTEDYTSFTVTSSLDSLASQICGSSAGNSGACCLYAPEKTYDAGTKTYISKNGLEQCIETSCWRCSEIAGRMDYNYVFQRGLSCASCSSTYTPTSKEDVILNTNPNPNTNLYVQSSNIKASKQSIGSILSVSIDFTDLPISQRIVQVENPSITVSGDGYAFSGYLITERNVEYGLVVVGLAVTSYGLGYSFINDISIGVDKSSRFTDRMKFIFDDPKGYATNPRDMFSATNLQYYISVKDYDVANAINQRNFTSYGLIENIEDTDGNIFGLNKNVSEPDSQRTLVKLQLRKKDASEILGTDFPAKDQAVIFSSKVRGKTVSFTKDSVDNTLGVLEVSSKSQLFVANTTLNIKDESGKMSEYLVISVDKPSINTNTGRKIFSNTFNYNISDTSIGNRGKELTVRIFQPF